MILYYNNSKGQGKIIKKDKLSFLIKILSKFCKVIKKSMIYFQCLVVLKPYFFDCCFIRLVNSVTWL